MARQTKAQKEAEAAKAAAAAAKTGDGDTPPPAPPTATPAATRARRPKPMGGKLEGHPLDVMIGVGTESTSIDGVDYVVDPETGRVTGTA